MKNVGIQFFSKMKYACGRRKKKSRYLQSNPFSNLSLILMMYFSFYYSQNVIYMKLSL